MNGVGQSTAAGTMWLLKEKNKNNATGPGRKIDFFLPPLNGFFLSHAEVELFPAPTNGVSRFFPWAHFQCPGFQEESGKVADKLFFLFFLHVGKLEACLQIPPPPPPSCCCPRGENCSTCSPSSSLPFCPNFEKENKISSTTWYQKHVAQKLRFLLPLAVHTLTSLFCVLKKKKKMTKSPLGI